MVLHALTDNLWAALLAWAVIYTSDYYLSIVASRLYQSGVYRIMEYGGGIELTPQFREDIASLRLLSPRWVRSLVLIGGLLSLLWFLGVKTLETPILFETLVVGLLLLEVAIHARHFRVLATYVRVLSGRGPTGRIEYPRWFSLEMSAVELTSFSVIYVVTALLSGEWSLLGGSLFCGAVGLRHWLWGRAELSRSESA